MPHNIESNSVLLSRNATESVEIMENHHLRLAWRASVCDRIPSTHAWDDKDKLARVVAPLSEWWRSGRALDSAARMSPAAERAWPPDNGQGRRARLAQRSGFAARPGLRSHVGPRRYSFERLAAIIAPARLSTETRLERRGPLVATVAGTGRASRKVTKRPRFSS